MFLEATMPPMAILHVKGRLLLELREIVIE